MNIHQIWESGKTDDKLLPPKQNDPRAACFSRLVHNIDHINDLSDIAVIDEGVVNLLIKKTHVNLKVPQEIILTLMGYDKTFTVKLVAIPFFLDGILAHVLYAANAYNLDLLRTHRNPVKPKHYDITDIADPLYDPVPF